MTPQNSVSTKPGMFYGWIVIGSVMLAVVCISGCFANSFGIFLPHMSSDLGWSRGTLSIAITIGLIAFGLPSPLFALFITRFGAKRAYILGNIVAGLAIAALSQVNAPWHLYLLYILIGLGAGLGGLLPSLTVANNWFIKKRPLVLGLVTASGGTGGFVFPPITTMLIETLGWRGAWIVLGAILLAVGGIICGAIIIRNRPEDIGQVPDGIKSSMPAPDTSYKAPVSQLKKEPVITIAALLKQRNIWYLSGFSAANGFIIGILSTHQVAHVQDLGYNPITAAGTISILFMTAMIGSIVFGSVALKFNVRILALFSFGCQLAGMVILLLSRDISWIYASAVLIGIGNGGVLTAMPTAAGFLYHGETYAKATGIILPFQMGFQAISGTIAGLIYDATLSYTITFVIIIAVTAFGMFMVFTMRLPRSGQISA